MGLSYPGGEKRPKSEGDIQGTSKSPNLELNYKDESNSYEGKTQSQVLFRKDSHSYNIIDSKELREKHLHWPLPWGFFLTPRVHILLQQHESKGRHFLLNLLFFVPEG